MKYEYQSGDVVRILKHPCFESVCQDNPSLIITLLKPWEVETGTARGKPAWLATRADQWFYLEEDIELLDRTDEEIQKRISYWRARFGSS